MLNSLWRAPTPNIFSSAPPVFDRDAGDAAWMQLQRRDPRGCLFPCRHFGWWILSVSLGFVSALSRFIVHLFVPSICSDTVNICQARRRRRRRRPAPANGDVAERRCFDEASLFPNPNRVLRVVLFFYTWRDATLLSESFILIGKCTCSTSLFTEPETKH